MSFTYERELPSPEQLKELLPVSPSAAAVRAGRIDALHQILTGRLDRLLLIVGPCSADNEEAVCEYAHRLAELQEQVQDKLFLVPRVYGNKPRTSGLGYKGILHQPDPMDPPNVFEGIRIIRHMHIRILEETGLVSADELLYPGNLPYMDDVLGYVAVGARSVENQQHRMTCSGLDIPVGMKNGTGGSVEVMFNAIRAAQTGHDFIYQGWEVATTGNPYTHGVLRGGTGARGHTVPNYHFEDLLRIAQTYDSLGLANPALIIDTNHNNSDRHYEEQPRIASDVMHSIQFEPLLRRMVKGFMIESYLKPGSQSIHENRTYGQSITDPCLGWEGTRRLILTLAEKY